MTAYDIVFTMVAGGTTIKWNARPDSVKYTRQAMIGTHQLPGGNNHAVQNMGHGGWRIQWAGVIYSESAASVLPITMTGFATARDIVGQLENWWTGGIVIVFRSDYIYARNGSATINVKIIDMEIEEIPGHSRGYNVSLVLQQFAAGSAFAP